MGGSKLSQVTVAASNRLLSTCLLATSQGRKLVQKGTNTSSKSSQRLSLIAQTSHRFGDNEKKEVTAASGTNGFV